MEKALKTDYSQTEYRIKHHILDIFYMVGVCSKPVYFGGNMDKMACFGRENLPKRHILSMFYMVGVHCKPLRVVEKFAQNKTF